MSRKKPRNRNMKPKRWSKPPPAGYRFTAENFRSNLFGVLYLGGMGLAWVLGIGFLARSLLDEPSFSSAEKETVALARLSRVGIREKAVIVSATTSRGDAVHKFLAFASWC